jgi:hypothetical protein
MEKCFLGELGDLSGMVLVTAYRGWRLHPHA